LLKEGRIPAKTDLSSFIENLRKGQQITDNDDAEFITRFEMQKSCPDILITNYSMLEHMLLRPREATIWNSNRQYRLSCVFSDKEYYFRAYRHCHR